MTGPRAVQLAALALGLGVRFATASSAGAAEMHSFIVDPGAPGASDGNAGTATSPLSTIGAALGRLGQFTPADTVTVRIAPGTYRESLEIEGHDRAPKLRVVAERSGQTVITGADPLSGWRQIGPGVFRALWSNPLPPSPIPGGWPTWVHIGPPALRRDLLFVDGKRFDEVYDGSTLVPGTFFVDATRGEVTVRVSAELDLAKARVERGVRGTLLHAGGLHGLELDGLVFSGAASEFNDSAVAIAASTDVRLFDDAVRDNNATGLSIGRTEHVTLENDRIVDNGSTGAGLWQIDDLAVRASTISHNNWRGKSGGFTGWAVAGAKLLQIHHAAFDDVHATGNGADGLWLDTDISDFTIKNSTMCGNVASGLELEASVGPVTVSDSTICNNVRGISGAAARGLSLTRDQVACNTESQIEVTGNADRPVTDHATGKTEIANDADWRLADDTIIAPASGSVLVGKTIPDQNWRAFLGSLEAKRNRWLVSGEASAVAQVADGALGRFRASAEVLQSTNATMLRAPADRCPLAKSPS